MLNWFIRSSVNRNNISLTVKGLVPLLVLFGVDQALIEDTSNSFVELFFLTGQLITAFIAFIGFVRKIIVSLQ